MRAARFHTFGPPDVLRVEEVPWPDPLGDELLVRVHASSINGTDLGLRRGEGPFALTTRRPFIPGFDVAGEVVRVGPRVTAFEPGDRVYALLGHGGGGAADYVTVRQAHVSLAPTSLPLAHAAAVPLAGLTAWQALREAANLHLRPGARVLIHGAAGGIGAFAVQFAVHLGARVSATARPEKLAFVHDLGAHEVLPAHQDVFGGNRQWDVILDTPSVLRFTDVRAALAPGGRLVSTRPFPTDPTTALAYLRRDVVGVMTQERGQDLARIARLIDAGAVRVPIDRTFDLGDIVRAHAWAEGAESRGKTIVTT